MTRSLRALLLLAALSAMVTTADAQAPDRRIADIVQAGKIRVGLHLPQFVKDPATGEIHGSGTGAVIEPLAERIGVKLELVGHKSPPMLVDCLKAQVCDMGFLGYVPARAGDVGYAPPHMFIPFT